ncbi:MAG: RNA polymerase sigma factor [Sideroxydans sp.]|nr:RNA polymerase sigma factor [Sideroxydans sp.]
MSLDEPSSVNTTAEATVRRSYGKLVAILSARSHDVAGAEDALSEAFAAALTDWSERGIPNNPEAWLLTVARRRIVDAIRQRGHGEQAVDYLQLLTALNSDDDEKKYLPDERLSLMFVCAHPAIEQSVRAPLMLQTILGFDAATIASAFLISPASMSQRLVRAKDKIRQAGIPFRIPNRAELPERLEAVLDAVYAAFAEGWTDPAGTETRNRNLATEAIWLARLVSALLPDEPEALGLLALMLYAYARRSARRSPSGAYIPLSDQDTKLWDEPLIMEAEKLLFSASNKSVAGRFQLEAAIQSAHVVRRLTGRTDWQAIEKIYDVLYALTGSPVVVINRTIAIAETRGVDSALAELETVAEDKRLAQYQPYWAARAELLARSGKVEAAKLAFQQAIGLESDPAVRHFLQQRLSQCTRS